MTVGHAAIVHGCTIGDRVLIGMGATVLNGATIGDDSIVAARSLVTEGTVIPPRSLVMGSPARVKRAVTDEEVASILEYCGELRPLQDRTTSKVVVRLGPSAPGLGPGQTDDSRHSRHARHSARRRPEMAARRARRARALRALRLRRAAHAGDRARGAVRQGHGRDHRHRPEGDVQLHRQGRRARDAAPGSDAEPGARVCRARPRAAHAGDETVHDGADVPVRAAAEGPLPSVPPARRRGLRHGRPGGGRRGDRSGVEPDRGARDCRQRSS